MRWRIKLEEYDYEVIYKAGKNNTNADCLSRIPHLNAITRSKTKSTADNPNSTQNTNSKIIEITDEEFKNKVLKEYHLTPIGGHQGFHRTVKRIKEKYVWKDMLKDIAKVIKNCEL